MPEISIIVPVYNVETYIERCIHSILNQTFTDFELLLVNDGSSDASGVICERMAKGDKRIKVIHKQNEGVSAARNTGLEISTGKYLMFCDSDDYVEPQWCEWLYNAIKRDNVYLALCGVECIHSESMKEYKGVAKQKVISRHEFVEIIPQVNLYELWNKIYIASIVRENGLRFNEKISRCEDALFTLKYLKLMGDGKQICYGSPALYHYYVNTSGSLTKQYVKNYAMIQKELLSNLLTVFEEFGICQKRYIEYYSVKAAYACSNIIANCFVKNNSETFWMKYNEISNLVKSKEYQVALQYGGMRQVAAGMYLSVLNKKNSILIFIYHYFHIIKFKLRKETGR